MTCAEHVTGEAGGETSPAVGLQLAFAGCVALVVLSLFASQVLVGPIAATFSLSGGATGLVTAAALAGYAWGLLTIVPMADIVENRRLVRAMLVLNVVALLCCAIAPRAGFLLCGTFIAGVSSSAIQILIPLIADITPAASRGRVVGNVMSGLMLGILVSRPLAALIADTFGWRASYAACALGSTVAIALAFAAPVRRPQASSTWPQLIFSLGGLVGSEGVLRAAALRQAACMCAFGLFWTAVPLLLSQPPFRLTETGIGLFALAGASSVVAAPLAGRLGDLGYGNLTRCWAYGAIIAASLAAGLAGSPETLPLFGRDTSLVLITIAACLLDLGVITDQALGRREVNLIRPEARGRINGLFTGFFFIGSAVGASASGIAYEVGGWPGACACAVIVAALPLAASLRPGAARF